LQIGNTKILRFVRSLENATPELDATIPRIPMVDFVLGTWPDFTTLEVEPFLESGFETEEEWYDHLADVGYFTEVTMCRYNATDWPDITDMPTAWTAPWVAIYQAAWETWWNSLAGQGEGIATKLSTDGVMAALDMEAWDGISIAGATFDAWDAITTVNGSLRNNYAWMADVPAGSEAYGNEVPVPRASINTYLGTSNYPIANVLDMLDANDAATATVWVSDPSTFEEEGDTDGGAARYKAYVEAILDAGVELIILFPTGPGVRADQDEIIGDVWRELRMITVVTPTADGVIYQGAPTTAYGTNATQSPYNDPTDSAWACWTVTVPTLGVGEALVGVELEVRQTSNGWGGQTVRFRRLSTAYTNPATWNTLNGAVTTPSGTVVWPSGDDAANVRRVVISGSAFLTLALDAIASRSSIMSFAIDATTGSSVATTIACIEDGDAAEMPVFNFTIVDRPTVTASTGSLNYTAGSGAVLLDSAITVTTDDTGLDEVAEAVVTSTGAAAATLDISGTHALLNFAGEGTSSLTITPKGGAVSAATMQAALRAVTITSAETAGDTVVEIEMTDTYSLTSDTEEITVSISEPISGGGGGGTGRGGGNRYARYIRYDRP
jgi:hypothetical protein